MRFVAVVVIALAVMAPPLHARDWVEGTHYYPVEPAPPQRAAADPVEVIEFFWYGCPHCHDLEPFLENWLAGGPEGVEFVRVPIMFGGAADYHAQMFYALEAIAEEARMTPLIFKEIHRNNNKLRDAAKVEAFLAEQGVDMDKFKGAMDSFAVKTKLKRARTLMQRFNVRSVPALVIDGRYRSGKGFAGYEDVIEVTRYLVDKVRGQRAANPANS